MRLLNALWHLLSALRGRQNRFSCGWNTVPAALDYCSSPASRKTSDSCQLMAISLLAYEPVRSAETLAVGNGTRNGANRISQAQEELGRDATSSRFRPGCAWMRRWRHNLAILLWSRLAKAPGTMATRPIVSNRANSRQRSPAHPQGLSLSMRWEFLVRAASSIITFRLPR